jgi:hypothetical protein
MNKILLSLAMILQIGKVYFSDIKYPKISPAIENI